MRLLLLMLATRALFSGAFADLPPPPFPPTDGSWTRQGVVIDPAGWEGTAAVEPSVLADDRWRMWYRGAWPAEEEAIGYAECSFADDPTVAGNWARHGGNPVVGLGAVTSDPVALPEVWKEGGTYRMTAVALPFTTSNSMLFAHSSDGLSWTEDEGSISLPSGRTMWGNRTVWHDGAQYQMLAEAGPSAWAIYRYSSADGLSWAIQNGGGALTSLQVAAGGMYGGPAVASRDGMQVPVHGGLVHLWYHAAPTSGNLPTNVYHATADPSDLDSWTKTGLVLEHAGSGFEADQVADPSVVVRGGTAYLFYDGDDNVEETAAIGVATAPAA